MAARLVSIPKKVNSPSLLFNYLVIHKTQKPSNIVMEVHHHPHVEKKNFKEYFLEFLMIFLAVTMGFFAENIREYFSNNERVAQLSRQMVQELKNDTATLDYLIDFEAGQRKKADSI